MVKDSPFLVLLLTIVFPKQTFMAFGTTALNPEVVNPFIKKENISDTCCYNEFTH